MNISIRTHHVEITPAIKSYIEKKLGKLEKFFNHIQEIAVEVDYSEVSDENQRQTTAVSVWVSGSMFRAKESHRDMYASVDLVFAKLERQLVKYKEKLKDRNRHDKKREFAEELSDRLPVNNRPSKAAKLYLPKPMYPEDAAAHMALETLDFFMFRNAETDEINVVYKGSNGSVELLEP
ncbi:ribosome-associated translation inhibitor RaiA [Candidatus Marinamargulisbacteria bacterium SCGC AG-439-L15]|nr:ribosome-associated translation inhibitor RaiA [Candidatus Marinamargulisbacteria bacterium SCGC AG-439-L15]